MEYIKNKEAIAIVKQMVADGQISQDVAEKYFPELKESEDEKIRKRLIELVKQSSDLLYPPNQKSMLAWLEKQGEKEKFIKKELGCIRGYREEAIRRLHELEKQGEQKLVTPKFRINDIIKYNQNQWTIVGIDMNNHCYDLDNNECVDFDTADNNFELVEQKSAEEYNITGIKS